MNYIKIVFLILFFSQNSFAEESSLIVNELFLKMEISSSNTELNSNMLVDLAVTQGDDCIFVVWNCVLISTDDNGKTLLLPLHYQGSTSSDDGGIRNISRSDDTVSFDLVMSKFRVIHIICEKMKFGRFAIKGRGFHQRKIHPNGDLREVHEEWKMVEEIILPSLEIR